MSAREEYTRRLESRRAEHSACLQRDARLSYFRLAVCGAALGFGWLAFGTGALSPWWLLLPAAVFGWLVQKHDVVIGRRDAAARAVAFYERGLARLDDRWMGGGEPGERFRNEDHLFADDLDLFGHGSLFELLSTARTRAGEAMLAGWLKTPAAPAVVRTRQQAVEEMAPLLDLRESMALAGSDVRAGVDPALLVEWAEAPSGLGSHWPWTTATVLTMGVVGAGTYAAMTRQYEGLAIVLLLQAILAYRWRGRVQRVLHHADRAARDLDVLAHVLARLERQAFEAPRLRELAGSLRRDGVPASRAIRRMHHLAEMHDWQHNQFFAPFAALLLWGTHVAHAIERWRARHGAEIAGWLASVGEFEAIGSLSAYHYEHPEDVFPALVEEGPGTFDGSALGHPLIAADRGVRNDVALTAETRLLVVSGSNMSGKSTLLRTVGVNAVLAFAGAPVRASRLRLTPLALGATLRIQDSLQEGRSRFYAEITRLRRIADLAAGPVPLLFLLDELFHGTNSHDRLVGATGILRALLNRGAIGLITTHDLALTTVAGDLAPSAANVHFEDTFEEGEIRFDYRVKPGPVTRSNAIALMRAVGLEVGGPESE